MGYQTELIESLGKIAVFTMLLLAVFSLTVKTKSKLPNRLFAVYLITIAFDLIGFFTTKTLDYPFIHSLKTASSLLQLPLFYLYVLAACYSNFKLKPKHLLHGLLFFSFFILFITTKLSKQSLLLYEIAIEIQYLAYIVTIFIVLQRYKTLYLENYSDEKQTLYKWLFQITLLSCIAHTFVLFRGFAANSAYHEYVVNLNVLISFTVLLVTAFFVLTALYQPALFTGINIHLEPSKSLLQEEDKLSSSNTAKNKDVDKLSLFMKNEQPYLNSELTLQKLAAQMDMPERYLSILINQHVGKHFFDFINEYRIKEAKKILHNPAQQELTIQEVLYMVGFNSKSSFYTAFKKATNQTPTAFRKNRANN